MNYYENNMECMKQYKVRLYQLLCDYDTTLYPVRLDWIQSSDAREEGSFLVVQKDGIEYCLNSSYSPKYEAEKWVEQYQFRNMNSIITMFGLGSGTFAREILKNRGEYDTLFIYEPSPELFFHVLNNYDITDILSEKNVILTIEGMNDFEFHNLLQNAVNITNITSQIRCMHPCYEQLFKESGIQYWTEIKDNYTHAKLNINTEMFFGKRYIKNSLYNTRFLKTSNRLLELKEDLDIDIPAIIVAAGPSLKKNIDELKRAKGKAYIFVVDRILDYVLDEGLEPDFIVTIDPIKPIEFFSKRTDLTIPMLCELVSNWEVLERHKGKKIIFSCTQFFRSMYDMAGIEPPALITGASVATAAFAACVQLGFERIVLVGQDLAYDGEYSHAGGVMEKIERARDVYVEGVDGMQVRSRSDWYEFIIWFNDMLILHPNLMVIDAKEKGAKIQGAINMPLKKVLDMYCTKPVDIAEAIKNKKSTFDDAGLEQIKKFFTDCNDEIDRLKKKAKEAIGICESQIRIYKRNGQETKESEKNFKKISKINRYFIEQPVYSLLETFITASSAQQISEIYHFTEDEQVNKIVTYEKSISIFEAIIDGVEFLRPLYDDMLETLLTE